jgi:methylisocitrate lyase
VDELGAMGYAMVLFPLTAFRVAMRAAEDALRTLHASGHQHELIPRMQTRADLYDALDYPGYEARDRGYLRGDVG